MHVSDTMPLGSIAKEKTLNVVIVPKWLELLLERHGLSIKDASNSDVLNRILSKDDVVFYSLFSEYVTKFFADAIVDRKYNETPFNFCTPELELMSTPSVSNTRAHYMKLWEDLEIREKMEQSGLSSTNTKGFLRAKYLNGKIYITIAESNCENLEEFDIFAASLYDAVSRLWKISDIAKTKIFDLYYNKFKNDMVESL